MLTLLYKKKRKKLHFLSSYPFHWSVDVFRWYVNGFDPTWSIRFYTNYACPCQLECTLCVIKVKWRPYQNTKKKKIHVKLSEILLFSQVVADNILSNKNVVFNLKRMQNKHTFTSSLRPLDPTGGCIWECYHLSDVYVKVDVIRYGSYLRAPAMLKVAVQIQNELWEIHTKMFYTLVASCGCDSPSSPQISQKTWSVKSKKFTEIVREFPAAPHLPL